MDSLYGDFGELLRAARGKAGLTQESLARRVGLSRTSITNIEKGVQGISLRTLFNLARALGVRPHQLLPEEAAKGGATEPDDFLPTGSVTPGVRRKVKRAMNSLSTEDREWVLRVLRGAAKDGVVKQIGTSSRRSVG